MKKFLVVVIALIFAQGCGDFLGSSKDNSHGGTRNTETGNANPFPKGYNPNAGSFGLDKMIANIGLNVIQPEAKNLRLQSEILESQIENYCQILELPGSELSAENEVKAQWLKTIKAYHFLAAVPFGPIMENGRFIFDNLYSWPSVSACGIDVAVEAQGRTGQRNPKLLTSVKGLSGLEYLLFEQSLGSQCNLSAPVYSKVKAWTEKDVRSKKQDRCQYALAIVEDIVSHTKNLEAAWDPQGRNFSKEFSESANLKEAVNNISDALFHFEEIKDERIGVPTGMHADCKTGKCPDRIEHLWSQNSFESIEARLEGFKRAFVGAQHPGLVGFGFDDFLVSEGRTDVKDALLQALDRVEVSLVAVKTHGTLKTQVDALPEGACVNEDSGIALCDFFHSLRGVSRLLKVDFLAALSLNAPPTHQGDND